MPASLKFCLERAAENATAARTAPSTDMREQYLTSELAWRAMADNSIEMADAEAA